MRAFVTGGAGFIGSTLADRLLNAGHQVTAYDNYSTGQRSFVAGALANPRYHLIEGDLLDDEKLRASIRGHDLVFHLAANADIKEGLKHPRRDLEQNTIATCSLLEAMRAAGVKRMVFSSTGSVYGEPGIFPTPETCPFPIQTSLYAASKLAGERGWAGHSTFIFLDTSRIRAAGWRPKLGIAESIERTLAWLVQNPEVSEKRD